MSKNIKVYFAGSDGSEIFHAALQAASVRYRLYSCFKFVDNKNKMDDFELDHTSVIRTQDSEMNGVIQDSGLFTLMFGAGKGRSIDLEYLEFWQDKLISFVKQNKLDCTCVEVDCQKILGTEAAWYLRKKLRDSLPNRQINVFHFEDGKEGLDRLIDFSEYIAISVPELRIIKPKSYKKYAVQLARYVKTKKPEIDIHMLGCTELSLLKDLKFCTSCDSTSWLGGVKYGWVNDDVQKGHVSSFKKELFNERKVIVNEILKKRGCEFSEKTLTYATRASLCASLVLNKYAEIVGSQE